MESIKETELNLQREVVTTVPNTWLVEAVNPSTGEKKMIDIANYASVVAGQMSYIAQEAGTGITDLNEVKGFNNKTVFYRFIADSTPSNTPIAEETRFYVEVANIGNSYISQRFIGLRSKVVYQRFFSNSKWSGWQRDDNFGYNTLEGLASGVAEVIGNATTSKNGLMPANQKGTTALISSVTEYSNFGVIELPTNNTCLFVVRPLASTATSIFIVGKGDSGAPSVYKIAGSNVEISFYYNNDGVFFKKRYGGRDSILPISANNAITLKSVNSLPADVVDITIK